MAFGRIAELLGNFEMSEWLLCIGLTYLLFESLRLIHVFLDKRFSFESGMRLRMLLQIGMNIFCSLILIGLGVSCFFIFVLGFRNLSSFSLEMWTMNAIFAVTTVAYTSAITSISILKIKNEKAWAEAHQRQQHLALNLLRYNQEIQPELLYTGLETVIPLLYQDPENADECIQKLSHIYRYQLEKRKYKMVRLFEEIRILQAWLYIWQQKYPNQIFCESNTQESLTNHWMPPGSIAYSISHLMQYVLFSPLQPLKLQLFIEENKTLKIRVNRNDRLIIETSPTDFLDVINKNYASFTEILVQEHISETYRVINLPLLEKDQSSSGKSTIANSVTN